MTTRQSGSWGSMPPVITRSAAWICASVRSSQLRLTSVTCQAGGSIAASVIRPRGGAGARAPCSSMASLKFHIEFS
jgi:hypothetical protein